MVAILRSDVLFWLAGVHADTALIYGKLILKKKIELCLKWEKVGRMWWHVPVA